LPPENKVLKGNIFAPKRPDFVARAEFVFPRKYFPKWRLYSVSKKLIFSSFFFYLMTNFVLYYLERTEDYEIFICVDFKVI